MNSVSKLYAECKFQYKKRNRLIHLFLVYKIFIGFLFFNIKIVWYIFITIVHMGILILSYKPDISSNDSVFQYH